MTEAYQLTSDTAQRSDLSQAGCIGHLARVATINSRPVSGIKSIPYESIEARIESKLEASLIAFMAIEHLFYPRRKKGKIINDRYDPREFLYKQLNQDKIEFIKDRASQIPDYDFTLVATPNPNNGIFQANAMTLKRLAIDFGEHQPEQTLVRKAQVFSGYNISRLTESLTPETDPIEFSVIENVAVEAKPISQQKRDLKGLQKEAPFLGIPNFIHTIGYMGALRAQGNKLVGENVEQLTETRLINLEEIAPFAWRGIPEIFIKNSGQLVIDLSLTVHDAAVRYAIL